MTDLNTAIAHICDAQDLARALAADDVGSLTPTIIADAIDRLLDAAGTAIEAAAGAPRTGFFPTRAG
jgi:hypothetical protein